MLIEANGLTIPENLNVELFKDVLKNGLNINLVQLQKISFSMGSNGGDNYASQIFRARIFYISNDNIQQTISLIIKHLPVNDIDLLKNVHECETKMYFEVIPELEKIYENKIKFAPKCLYASETPIRVMIFEDLCDLENCELRDRVTGYDESDANKSMEFTAKFHAASMVLAEKYPNIMKSFNKSVFHLDDKSNASTDEIFLGNFRYIQKLISNWPNFENIAKKLKNLEAKFYEHAKRSVILRENAIAVLNHGDLWINNILFKRNSSQLYFIDFQLSYFGSLGIDINYFLNTSIDINVLKTKRNELLRTYYKMFKESLEFLQFPMVPSWENVLREINYTEFYGFVSFEAVLPLAVLDRDISKDNSLDSLTDADKMEKQREIVFKTKRMIEATKYSLQRFDELGLFD